jgi:hypothetical protein
MPKAPPRRQELLNNCGDSPLVYRAFRNWSTSALWVLTGRRHLSLADTRAVYVRRCHEARFATAARDTVRPSWWVQDCTDVSVRVNRTTAHKEIVVVTWFDREARAAELVGKGSERTFEVKYVKTGEHGTVPFHAALWGPRQQIVDYL